MNRRLLKILQKQEPFVDSLAVLFSVAILVLMGLSLLDVSIATSDSYATLSSSDVSQQYEQRHIIKNYPGNVIEVTDYGLSDEEKQALFDTYREKEDWQAEYQEARARAELDSANSFQEYEEERITAYCNDNGYASCYNIQYTCQKYDCYAVTIICRDKGYNPMKELQWGKKYGCDEWKVTVDKNSFKLR